MIESGRMHNIRKELKKRSKKRVKKVGLLKQRKYFCFLRFPYFEKTF